MTPAQLVIDRFGSQKEVASILGLRPSAIVHWTKTGMIPPKHHATLLGEAARRNIRLAPNELVKASPPPTSVEVPNALYAGELSLGGDGVAPIRCYVLEDGRRVISRVTALKALAGGEGRRTGGDLEKYVKPLGVRMQQRLADELIEFKLTGSSDGSTKTFGISAEFFLDLCKAYVAARDGGELLTDRQVGIAIQANAFLAACATVGLIALIDEATGYQYDRDEDALRTKLAAFLEEEMRPWEKTFPDELWLEFGRLTGWKGSVQSRPKYWGHLVMELIYEPLDADVAEWLKGNAPSPRHGQNYHQWLSGQYGLKKLVEHIWMVIGMARACSTMQELRYRMAERYGKQPVQLMMFIDPPMGR